jgi:hypothetical protein
MYQNLIEDLTEAAQLAIEDRNPKLAAVCIVIIVDLIRQESPEQERDYQSTIERIALCLRPRTLEEMRHRFTCANCGKEHQPCPCGNPTYCPPEEPGEPFHYCDKCDAAIEAAERLAADKARKEVATLIMGVAGDLQHSKGSYRSIVRRNKPQEVVFVAYGEDQAQADAFAALVIKGVIDMR